MELVIRNLTSRTYFSEGNNISEGNNMYTYTS